MGFNRFVLTAILVSSMTLNHQEATLNTIDSNPVEESIEIEEIKEEPIEEELIEEPSIEDEEIIEEENLEEEIKEQEESKKEIVKFKVGPLELRQGIANEEVLRIKKFFKEKGYENIDENYYFDYRLNEIVMEYQRNNGLKSDGIIGKATYETINNDMELNNISIPKIEVSFLNESSPKEMIIINKDSNTLYHIKEGKVLGSFPVATGKTPSHTPEGRFTIVVKYVNPAWGGAGRYTPIRGGAPNNPLGKRWMGLSIKGGGVYGIHGNSDKSSIGKYISLGCIRMFNEEVEYLYDLIDIGTPVWIGNEIKLQEYGVVFR